VTVSPLVLTCAVRYALGRQTYAVNEVARAAMVEVHDGRGSSVGIGVQADQRQEAARALAGEDFVVISVAQLDALEADMRGPR
jgi:hypothetical protein